MVRSVSAIKQLQERLFNAKTFSMEIRKTSPKKEEDKSRENLELFAELSQLIKFQEILLLRLPLRDLVALDF